MSVVEYENSERSCEVKFQRFCKGWPAEKKNQQFILDRLDIVGTKDQQVELSAVLAKYTNVFALEDEDLGYTGSSREVGPA